MTRKSSEQIRDDYRRRLLLPVEGNPNIIFYTKSNLKVAQGYEKVVIGDRGPYIEFSKNMINIDAIYIPTNQKWRIKHPECYYIEWRTTDEYFVKLYQQRKIVEYADYKINMWYISPFDLVSDQYPVLVCPLEIGNEK